MTNDLDMRYDNPAKIVTKVFMKSGLTQKEFAQKAGISMSSLSTYLSGNVQPRPQTMVKIENAFGGQQKLLPDTELVDEVEKG